MMKYPAEQMSVGAIYDNAPADNPFLAALPGLIPQQEFMSAVKSMPPFPAALPYGQQTGNRATYSDSVLSGHC